MVNRIANGDVKGWLQLGGFLLLQTVVAVAFIVRLEVDVEYIKSAVSESRQDRALMHSEISTLSAKLDQHMLRER